MLKCLRLSKVIKNKNKIIKALGIVNFHKKNVRGSRIGNDMLRESSIITFSIPLTLLCDSFFTKVLVFKCFIFANIWYILNNVSKGYCFIPHYFERCEESGNVFCLPS